MQQSYETWRLVLLSPWPVWALVLLGAACVGGVVLAWLGLRKERRLWLRTVLVGLRAVSMLALLFVVAEPGVRWLQTAQVKGRLAILVDTSASMALPVEEGGAARSAEAADWLAAVAPQLRELESRYHLETYRFDTELSPVSLGAIEEVEPRGDSTDLVGALSSLESAGTTSRKLVGALVLSDGGDNVELRRGLSPRAKQRLESLQIPVSTVSLGSTELRDLAIDSVQVEDFAFVRNSVEIDVVLTASRMGDMEVPLVLRREGQVVAQQTVALRKDQQRYEVKLSFIPDEIGEFVFSVGVPVYADEASTENNSRTFVLKVIRDRVRTLLVVGRPSWDQRFLRTLLRNDPNVDLVSFFILRTPQDQPKASESELSLIPFPVDEIFDKQLWSFDLVIFQNFNYRPYRMDRYLPNLQRYVEEGGAFVMIGGENSFGEGGYQSTPLAQILPVEIDGRPPDENLFPPRLTEDGLRHPITQIALGPEANQAAWASLPELPGVNVTRAKPGARVLLDHPHLLVGGQNAPLLAVWEVGRGRAMALTSDASWYWSMVASGEGGGASRAYERLWSNAMRWLVRDPELRPVQVQAAQRSLEPREPIAAQITARRQDYAQAAHADLQVRLIDVESGQVVATEQLGAGPDGVARVEFESPGPGAYRLVAEARDGGHLLGEGEDVVAVRSTTRERSDIRPRPELLQEIAEVTGGAYVSSSERRLPAMRLPPPEEVEVGRSEDRPIWDRFWPLVVLGACLGAEWVLRRRWGYA